MRPDRLQDKERSARLSQKENVSFVRFWIQRQRQKTADRKSDEAASARRHALNQISQIRNGN